MGMDGVILTAFILGLPANEIVLPIILMAYTAQGSLTNFENMGQLKEILLLHGWTWKTAVCVLLFSLMHWPCSTTLITLYKETKVNGGPLFLLFCRHFAVLYAVLFLRS